MIIQANNSLSLKREKSGSNAFYFGFVLSACSENIFWQHWLLSFFLEWIDFLRKREAKHNLIILFNFLWNMACVQISMWSVNMFYTEVYTDLNFLSPGLKCLYNFLDVQMLDICILKFFVPYLNIYGRYLNNNSWI